MIANDHPDPETAGEAMRFYQDAVNAQHLTPESRRTYEARMTDNPTRITEGLS